MKYFRISYQGLVCVNYIFCKENELRLYENKNIIDIIEVNEDWYNRIKRPGKSAIDKVLND